MNYEEFIEHLNEVIRTKFEGKQSAFADACGISRAYVSDIVNGNRKPSRIVLDFLEIEEVVRYEFK